MRLLHHCSLLRRSCRSECISGSKELPKLCGLQRRKSAFHSGTWRKRLTALRLLVLTSRLCARLNVAHSSFGHRKVIYPSEAGKKDTQLTKRLLNACTPILLKLLEPLKVVYHTLLSPLNSLSTFLQIPGQQFCISFPCSC